ncbi:MAG TPA: alanine racemase [Spirochaetota bacterium]|nr:alanine racemase [Spirochaetota bacterium]
MNINKSDSPIYAEVDLEAFRHNFHEIKRLLSGNTKIMAVVKADAYGHGADVLAREAEQNGADYLAVARMNEAVRLRNAGIKSPILLFDNCEPASAARYIELDIRPTLNNSSEADAYSAAAKAAGKILKVHIKVDTGMGRLGFLSDPVSFNSSKGKLADEIVRIAGLPFLEVEGVYSHFANADSADKTHALEQLARFKQIAGELTSRLDKRPLFHIANSAAVMEMPDSHMDIVRPGIMMYGIYPSKEVDRSRISLRPVLSFKSEIIHVKKVGSGFCVSYGSTFVTSGETVIATVPAGYADGYNRQLSSRGEMIVRGMRAPILGRVCMDLTMLDVTHIPGVSLHDEVVLIGSQGTESITAEDIADKTSTIGYEVLTSISPRVHRIYTN